jgi:CHAT domain-containing protein
VSREDKHLSLEQIEWVCESQPGVLLDPAPSGVLEEAHRHLVACEACQKLVLMHKEIDRDLRGLRVEIPKNATGSCPPEQTLNELVAGAVDSEQAKQLLSHALQCDHCGPLLRLATEIFSPEKRAEEESVLSSLQSSRLEWQETLARKLAGRNSPIQATSGLVPHGKTAAGFRTILRNPWAYAVAAAVALCVITSGSLLWHSSPIYANKLLAEAYSEHRTLEVRIPGAKHAQMRVERGAVASSLDKPATLLKAETLIAGELRKNPNDPTWLQAKAQADLLDGNFDSAVHTAELALEQETESASLLAELGSAYFQRAERDRSAIDYGRAYECLSKSLAKRPDDPVTLFNRAVVSEHAQLYAQAQEDWNRYLNLDTDQEWRAEARTRLKEVERKLQEQKNRSQMSFDSPEQLVTVLSGRQEERIAQVDSVVEGYQQLALEKWFPELTSGRILDSRRRELLEKASHSLAADLQERHGDRWFTDFLSGLSFERSSQSISLLASAIRANAGGDYGAAIQLAARAETEFRNDRDEPGLLRAELESIYSARLAARGGTCYEKANSLLEKLTGRDYAWLEIQTRLERAACAAQISRVDEAVEGSRQALEGAVRAKYGSLYLRATVFAADLTADPNKRFTVLNQGLTTYWNGCYEPMRGYSLYAVMDTTSDDLGLRFLDEAIIKEGLRLISDDSDVTLRGTEQYRLARAQIAIGELEESRLSLAKARGLLEKNSSRDLMTINTVELAEAYVVKGQYRQASDLLDSVEPGLMSLSDDIITARFYSARVTSLLGEGRSAEAKIALDSTLHLARKGLDSISVERDRFDWIQTFSAMYKSLAYIKLSGDVRSSFAWWEAFKGASLQGPHDQESAFLPDPALPSFPAWPADGKLLVSYAIFPDGVAIWIYDGREVHSEFVRTSVEALESMVHRFSENCGDPVANLDDLRTQGRELFELLVKPISGRIRGKSRLIFETDDAIGSVPFEALVDEKGKYLAESYEIEYTPGLEYLALTRRPEQISRSNHALVVGQAHADLENGLPPLPDSLTEAREIAGRFDKPMLLMEDEANIERVLHELPDAEIFHFAGHALANGRVSGLLLGDSADKMTARYLVVRQFDGDALLRARLVVLSACSTANGTFTTVNNRDSLARSALAASVPNVVASRWVVDSGAARQWMLTFYDELLKGNDVGMASKEARLKLSVQQKWKHPFYWATFGVFV